MADTDKSLVEAPTKSNHFLPSGNPDFFKCYLDYAGVGVSEPPVIFHRWCAIGIIGALLGRQAFLPFGHGIIYPNQYIMLMGAPGTRKSTSINIGKKLLSATGYSRYASDRSSKERFLMDMKQFEDSEGYAEADLEALTLDEPAETFVVAEEFTDFVGNNNMDFITLLTKLWDCPAEYSNPKIHGKSVVVHEPTVNILSGNTVQGFALAFPPEALGNGFLSRMIFIHGEETGRKVTFPPIPDPLVVEMLAQHLRDIKLRVKGDFKYGEKAELLVDKIYKASQPLDDPRFKHYHSRRLAHMLKLAMIIAATDLTLTVREEHVLMANTFLHYAELKMPKALGEFGKSKYSEVSNSILDYLARQHKPVSITDIWKIVGKDLTKITELGDIMKNLALSDKVQSVMLAGKQGFMQKVIVSEGWDRSLVVASLVTEEEKMGLGD